MLASNQNPYITMYINGIKVIITFSNGRCFLTLPETFVSLTKESRESIIGTIKEYLQQIKSFLFQKKMEDN